MSDKTNNELKSVKREYKRQALDWSVNLNHAIFRVTNAIETSVNKKQVKYGISQRGIAILYLLVENNGMIQQKNIAKNINRTKQAVTSALSNLEKHGYITRETGGKDLRRRIVRITEKGLKVARECLPLRKQSYDTFSASMTREEGHQLTLILERLSDSIYDEMKTQSKPE